MSKRKLFTPLGGRWEYRSSVIPNGVAGQPQTLTIPDADELVLVAARCTFTTSAVVANRFVGVGITPTDTAGYSWGSNNAVLASTSRTVQFGWALNLSVPNSNLEQVTIAPLIALSPLTLFFSAINIDAGDVFSAMRWDYFVRRA